MAVRGKVEPSKEWLMFEGLFAPLHLIVILAIVLIVFGPGRLPELGESLGKAIRSFKQGLEDSESTTTPKVPEASPDGKT
jgi:sec-independent protein translocase protein TatA